MRSLVLLLASMFAFGCTPKSTPTPAEATPPATTAPVTTTGEEGCTRGDAAAVLDPAKVTGHAFTRGVGPRAEEKATIPGGIALTVLHTGCEHFVERYSFRLPHDGTPGPDYPWLTKTAELVKSLPVRADRAATVAQWAERLSKRGAEKPAYVMGEEIALETEGSSLSLQVTPQGGESEIELVYDATP